MCVLVIQMKQVEKFTTFLADHQVGRRGPQVENRWFRARDYLFASLPLPSLLVRYAHLTVMISLSRERGLLWLRHEPLLSLALRFGTIPFLNAIHFINW